MVSPVTQWALMVYKSLKRAERRVERLSLLLGELVKKIPGEEMSFYYENTKMFDLEEEVRK